MKLKNESYNHIDLVKYNMKTTRLLANYESRIHVQIPKYKRLILR